MSESKFEIADRSGDGRGRGGGKEKSREVLRRFAVGDSRLNDMPDITCAGDLSRCHWKECTHECIHWKYASQIIFGEAPPGALGLRS